MDFIRTKKFFFWGIFKKEGTVHDFLGVPKSMVTHKVGKKDGVIVDFSNKSNEEFLRILGTLATIETGYLLAAKHIGSVGWVYFYLPYHMLSNKRRMEDSIDLFFLEEC